MLRLGQRDILPQQHGYRDFSCGKFSNAQATVEVRLAATYHEKKGQRMNILLHGMQSSGASLLAFFIGQLPRSVVIVDVTDETLTPSLADAKSTAEHVIAKCVITTEFSLDDHIASFQPDLKLLVLRHPAHNYVSLRRKPYKNWGGAIDDKFRKLEDSFCNRNAFDGVLLYADFLLRPVHVIETLNSLGVGVSKACLEFSRSREDIIQFNFAHSAWCRDQWGSGWGFGNIKQKVSLKHSFKYIPPTIRSRVESLCPRLCAYMDEYHREHVPCLARWSGSIWHDWVMRNVKDLTRSVKAAGRHRGALGPTSP